MTSIPFVMIEGGDCVFRETLVITQEGFKAAMSRVGEGFKATMSRVFIKEGGGGRSSNIGRSIFSSSQSGNVSSTT